MPISVVNVLIDLGQVCQFLRVWAQLYYSQAVADNKGTMKGLIDNLMKRIMDVSEAYKRAKSDDARMRIDNFVQ